MLKLTSRLKLRFLLLVLGLLLPALATAQEILDTGNADPQETIQLEWDAEELTESMRLFLKEYKLDLQQSNIDLSDILRELREQQKKIKKEHQQTVETARRSRPPRLVKLKRRQKQNEIAANSVDPDELLLELQIPVRSSSRIKEQPLSLEERQRLAAIENKRLEQLLREERSEKGQLKRQIEKDPLKSHQAQLLQFSDKIKDLLNKLKTERVDPRSIFLELGNVYLESERYINALNAKDRSKLIRYASYTNVTLGSHESALWAFKMALDLKPNDGKTNVLIAEINSEMGQKNRAVERAKNAERWFAKNQQREKAEKARSYAESFVTTP